MKDIARSNVYRVATKNVYNVWHELVFSEDQILHCIQDARNLWLARPIGSDAFPRWILKSECRELTESEKRRANLTLLR